MEENMPDLKTALETALKEWDDDSNQPKETPMKPQIFKPTNNVTRETFQYVKQNKGCTKAEVRKTLMARGFKDNSITSLLAQMIRSNFILVDSSGGLHTVVEDYMPLKSAKTKNKAAKPSVKAVKVKEPHEPLPMPEPEIKHLQSRSWTAEELLNKLNIVEAKALYKELTRVFSE
jgi:hypothetical protein